MTQKTPHTDSPPREPGLTPRHEARLDALIGTKLRSYYDELMAEPVPNRILDLLAELEAREEEEAQQDGPRAEKP